jgi:signal peptidase II
MAAKFFTGLPLDGPDPECVTDFIDLPLWPPFNVADMAITFGVLTLLYALEAPRGRRKRDDAHEAS